MGLAAGALLGIAGAHADVPWIFTLSDRLGPLGAAWMLALRVSVLPLVVVQMTVAVLGGSVERGLGRMAGRSLLLMALLLVGGGVVTAAVSPTLVALYHPSPETLGALRAGVDLGTLGPAASSATGDPGRSGLGAMFVRFVRDLLMGKHILLLLLAAAAGGIAARHMPAGPRGRIEEGANRLSRGLLRAVRWILVATPLGVFVIVLGMSLEIGLGAAGMILVFVVMMSGLLVLATAALYPVAWLLGRRPPGEFARALLPPQLVAVSTRSSIASLPALVEEGEATLELPREVTGMVLPLAVSVFKMNMPISSTFQLIFLGAVFGVHLSPWTVASFMAAHMLLSVGTLGIPGDAGGMRSMPMYLAAGIPLEGYLLTTAAETVPDIFKTLVNVTADMTVAVAVAPRPGGALAGSGAALASVSPGHGA